MKELRAELPNHVQNTNDLGAVARHLAVPGLAPSEDAVAVDDERRSVRDVPVLVEHAVLADHTSVHVTEQWKAELSRASEGLVARRAVAADREQRGAPRLHRARDLIQAAQFRRSDTPEVKAVKNEHDIGLALEFCE